MRVDLTDFTSIECSINLSQLLWTCHAYLRGQGMSFEASSHCFDLADAKRSQIQKAYSEKHQQPRLSKRQIYEIYMKLYT